MRTFLFSLITALGFHSILFSADPEILIDENFSGESLPSDWQPGGTKGSWTIIDGTLRGVANPNDSHGPSIGVPIKGENLVVEFDFRYATKGKGYFLFLIDGDSQFKGQAHLLRFAAHQNVATLMQDRGDPASKKAQKIAKDKNGGKRTPPTKEQLADSGYYRIERLVTQKSIVSDGEWHHVKIELKGNLVTARVDQNPEISGKGTVLDVSKSRIVFLVGQSGDIRIDKVKIVNR